MKMQRDPTSMVQTAAAFWASKVLLTVVELGLFTTPGDRAATAEELGHTVGLRPRGTYDFFDALAALKFLDRDGDGSTGRYKNTSETGAFLNKNSPAYIGGLSEMLNARLLGFRNDLGIALRPRHRAVRVGVGQ